MEPEAAAMQMSYSDDGQTVTNVKERLKTEGSTEKGLDPSSPNMWNRMKDVDKVNVVHEQIQREKLGNDREITENGLKKGGETEKFVREQYKSGSEGRIIGAFQLQGGNPQFIRNNSPKNPGGANPKYVLNVNSKLPAPKGVGSTGILPNNPFSKFLTPTRTPTASPVTDGNGNLIAPYQRKQL